MYLSHENRQPITWALVWELPIAVGMGWLGRGFGDWLHLDGFPLFAMSIMAGYLGPRCVSWFVQALSNWVRLPLR